MADHPGLAQFVISGVKFTGRKIGTGTHGSVEEVSIPGAICAAKKFNFTPQNRADEAVQETMVRFVEECQLLSRLRHPHIVSFLGICFFPDTPLPALVMERLSSSLHNMLLLNHTPSRPNEAKPHMPLTIKFSIIRDITNGLLYLHKQSHPIVHGNLTAQNVLLDSALVAKISDVRDPYITAHLTSVTMPKRSTAFVYMPPEIRKLPAFSMLTDSNVDIFAFGVIAMFTLTQMFPYDLTDVPYDDKSSGIASTELEQRKKYMQSIYSILNQSHPLVLMIQQCIQNLPQERPVITQVVELIDQVWAEVNTCEGYRECNLTRLELIQALLSSQQTSNKTHPIAAVKVEEKVSKNAKSSNFENLSVTFEKAQQETLSVETLDCEREEPKWMHPCGIPPTLKPTLEPHMDDNKAIDTLKVQCYMQRPMKHSQLSRGAAIIDGNFAYFTPCDSNCVYRYNIINGEWLDLPDCMCSNASLAVIDGTVITIGGVQQGSVTNKLYTLQHNNCWVENSQYPPMSTSRSHCAVVSIRDSSYSDHVIVIGGKAQDGSLINSVDFLDTQMRCWYNLSSLPQPLFSPTAIQCGDMLYVIGSGREGYSCSIQQLLNRGSLDESHHLALNWLLLPPLPVSNMAVATLRRQPILIGGVENDTVVSCIYQLVEQRWVKIGATLVSRRDCLVLTPSHDKVIIVGGIGSWNCVELCNAEY